ncbi:HNH endonuclease [Rarobacter incanus]|uniref:HNH endonuclease n=1 Tax=Rarobacter incanus TaxID=153494 RepID=A0A542SQ83_9MICO|nr:HNH endonuclease [Rarobacter incanus]
MVVSAGAPSAPAVEQALDGSLAADPGDAAVAALDSIYARIRALESAAVAQVACIMAECQVPDIDQNVARRHGYRNATALVEGVTRLSGRSARMIVGLANATAQRVTLTGEVLEPQFRNLADAVGCGALNVETASAIVAGLGDTWQRADLDDFAAAEHALIDMATGRIVDGPGAGLAHSCDLVASAARLWKDRIDPDGVEPRADVAAKNRQLWISKRAVRGLHKVRGEVPTDVAARFHALIDAQTDRMREASEGGVGGGGGGDGIAGGTCAGGARGGALPDNALVRACDDRRTLQQLGADLLATLLADYGSTQRFGGAAAVLVTIAADPDNDELARTGDIAGVAVPRSMVEQWACNAGVQRVWTAPSGRVAVLETPSRAFSGHQRRAIAARDGNTCLVPHCAVPAAACEAHHVTPWALGGKTVVDNGVLLCWSHHRTIERGYWAVSMWQGRPVVTHATRPPHPMGRGDENKTPRGAHAPPGPMSRSRFQSLSQSRSQSRSRFQSLSQSRSQSRSRFQSLSQSRSQSRSRFQSLSRLDHVSGACDGQVIESDPTRNRNPPLRT